MTEDEEVAYLWGIALTTKKGWQYSDFPVVQDSSSSFERAWKKARKKKRISNGEPVTVGMIERQWLAESTRRKQDRERKVFVPQPVGISAYCNQDRWNNYLETKESPQNKDARKCKCGKDTPGPKYSECDECRGKDENGKLKGWEAEMMRDYYKRHPEIDHAKLAKANHPSAVSLMRQMLSLAIKKPNT